MFPILCKFAIVAGVAAAGYAASRVIRHSGRVNEREHLKDILKEVLEVRQVPKGEVEGLLSAVMAQIRSGARFADYRMAPVFRIESLYSKAEDGAYGQEILVYVADASSGKAKVTRVRKPIDWAYIPTHVRKALIAERGERETVLIYERKD